MITPRVEIDLIFISGSGGVFTFGSELASGFGLESNEFKRFFHPSQPSTSLIPSLSFLVASAEAAFDSAVLAALAISSLLAGS